MLLFRSYFRLIYYYAFTLGELVNLVRQAGFEIVEVKKGSDLFIAARKNNRIRVMDVPFDAVDRQMALGVVLSALKNDKQLLVVTPNPEMLLEARRNMVFKTVLQNAGLSIPDGAGIKYAASFQGTPLKERVTGTDLMQLICGKAPVNARVFLLGAIDGVAKKAADNLRLMNPGLQIVGVYSGSPAEREQDKILELINKSGANILFVAFGAPNQELWLARNLKFLPTVKVAMGVGGAFDFIAGEKKRAPLWMQQAGLEWLYRLLKEPKRIKRIINATIVFPILFLIDR